MARDAVDNFCGAMRDPSVEEGVRRVVLGVWATRAAALGAGPPPGATLLESVFLRKEFEGSGSAAHAEVATFVLGAASVAIPGYDTETPYFRRVVQWACGFAPAPPRVSRLPLTRISRQLAFAVEAGVVAEGGALPGLDQVYPGPFAEVAEDLWGRVGAEVARIRTRTKAAKVWLFPPGTIPGPPGADAALVSVFPGVREDGARVVHTPLFAPAMGTRVWVEDPASGALAMFGVLDFALTAAPGTLVGILAKDGEAVGTCTGELRHVTYGEAVEHAIPAMTPDRWVSPGDLAGDTPTARRFKGITSVMLTVVFGEGV